MAYLRTEQETVETDFPLETVWGAIPKAITNIEWTVEAVDEATHEVKAKTKANFMSYSSTVIIKVTSKDTAVTRISVLGETPVTTLTALVDFGRTRERVDLFLASLQKQLAEIDPTLRGNNKAKLD